MIHFSQLKSEITIPPKVQDVYRLLWNLLPPTSAVYSVAMCNTHLQNLANFYENARCHIAGTGCLHVYVRKNLDPP